MCEGRIEWDRRTRGKETETKGERLSELLEQALLSEHVLPGVGDLRMVERTQRGVSLGGGQRVLMKGWART